MTDTTPPTTPTGTPLSTVNKVATAINTGIVAGEDAGVALVESAILADQPWLGLPVICQIWEGVFSWVASYFVKIGETGVTFGVIDIQTGLEKMGISSALAAIAVAEKSGNAAQIQAAIQQYQKAQSALVNTDGSSTPQ